jgi:hypothetical protein
MNVWDKNNLEFIMSLKGDQVGEWMDNVEKDDIDYALELIERKLTELNLELIEAQDDVEDLTLANTAINTIFNKAK